MGRSTKRWLRAAAAAVLALAGRARAEDVSAPVILQWFEASWQTVERRTPDFFMTGYGGVWLPPAGRADSSNYSVGYDVYDRFDLGKPGNPTLYGTEAGLKTCVSILHRAGKDVYVDFVINHSGFTNSGSVDGEGHSFVAAGDYPGFVTTLPGAVDGDYHTAFPPGGPDYDQQYRLAGLVDIDQRTNHQFVRSPVPGYANNIPAGTVSAFGRIADVPDENNRRFYPDQSLDPIIVFDPKTGEGGIRIHPFNNTNPMAGDPVPENAMGYLMRHAQWMVQAIRVDGFRVDAARHVYPFVHEFFDRAVYRSSFRTTLDGQQKQVFSFLEAYTGDKNTLQGYIRKDISPADAGRVGGNRDVLDFPLFFALRDNLTDNGYANNWHRIRSASQDSQDDGLANNGSQGMAFAVSHDDGGPALSNVAHAYVLLRPGNAIVYHNAKEFGDNRDFPKDGRGDAFGGLYGDAITKLVEIRNTHGRGNFAERWIDDAGNANGFSNIYVYERLNSAIVGLNNRNDGGFDERAGVQTGFAPGTHLIELTGNAANTLVDPGDDIHEVLTVKPDGTIDLRIPRNKNYFGQDHGRGYVIYGVSGPQGSLSLTNVTRTLAGQTPTAQTNGTARLADIDVISADSFGVRLDTAAVNLLANPALRDRDADGDSALLSIDGGADLNGNGRVDHVTPGSVVYGFEEFSTARSPGYFSADGNGAYAQDVDATQLPEGMHFLTVRAFRHRNAGEPAVFTDFKRAIYIDRLKPISAKESFEPLVPGVNEDRQFVVRSVDLTADNVHVLFDLPAGFSDQQVLGMIGASSQGNQIDRDLWTKNVHGLTHGNHAATIVTWEITGNHSIQRIPGLFVSTIFGAGLGDINHDGAWTQTDIQQFDQILYSGNMSFDPAADLDGDGLVGEADLIELGPKLSAVSAGAETLKTYNNLIINPPAGMTRSSSHPLDNAGGGDLIKASGGRYVIAGAQIHGPGASITVWNGELRLATDAGAPGSSHLALIVEEGSVEMGTRQHLAGLFLHGGIVEADEAQVLAMDELAVTGGVLSLGRTALVLPSGSLLAQLANWADSGRISGGEPGEVFAAIVNDFGDGTPLHAVFRGESVGSSALLAAWTRPGDADLTGVIDGDDYFLADRGFLTQPGGWLAGDFNRDGRTDARDYALMDRFYLLSQPAMSAVAVPEPSGAAVLLLSLMFLRRQRSA